MGNFDAPFQLFNNIHATFLKRASPDIEFNASSPNEFIIGQQATIEWSGGNGQPVSLFLSDGIPIVTICANVTSTSCSWIPASTIDSGAMIDTEANYLLEIDQQSLTPGGSPNTYSEGPVYVDFAPSVSTSSSSVTPVPTSTPAPKSSSANSPDTGKSTKSLSGGAIAEIAVGAVVLICILFAAYLLFRRRRARKSPPVASGSTPSNAGYEKPELGGENKPFGYNAVEAGYGAERYEMQANLKRFEVQTQPHRYEMQ